MMLSARRVVVGALGAGAMTGAMLFGASSAVAAPPNCTAADLAGVASGVAASTSAYLFTHPEVNGFFTSLEGKDRDTIKSEVQDYMDANPQVEAELTGIRQPLTDLKNRCGHDLDPASPAN